MATLRAKEIRSMSLDEMVEKLKEFRGELARARATANVITRGTSKTIGPSQKVSRPYEVFTRRGSGPKAMRAEFSRTRATPR